MQANGKVVEREAYRRLPQLLGEMLDEEHLDLDREQHLGDQVVDAVARDARGRIWAIEIKTSSRPNIVEQAAQRLRAVSDLAAIPILVVPYMSKGGADAAEQAGL